MRNRVPLHWAPPPELECDGAPITRFCMLSNRERNRLLAESVKGRSRVSTGGGRQVDDPTPSPARKSLI